MSIWLFFSDHLNIFWLTQCRLSMQCFWQCIAKYLTKWNFFPDQVISIQPPPSSLQPPEQKKTLLLSSILFLWEKPLCTMKWIFWQYVVLKHISLEGNQVNPQNHTPSLHAIVNTFPRIYFLFVPLIDGRFLSRTKLPYFQPQALPSSPNSSQRRLQALQKWRCLCVNSEKRSSANKCK